MTSAIGYSLCAERVAGTLAVIAAVLVVLHLLAMQIIFNPDLGVAERFGLEYWQLSIFDLDEEESFRTWFSAVMLLIAGQLLLMQAKARRREEDGWHGWWLTLGIGFYFLSIDEVVGLHELMNSLMEETPWTIVAFPILGIVGVAFLPFLWRLPRRTALLLLLAGAIYGGGAVGVEHFTGADANSLSYNMWTALEEGMEMAGVILFLYALLDHMRGTPAGKLRLEMRAVNGGMP